VFISANAAASGLTSATAKSGAPLPDHPQCRHIVVVEESDIVL
jgi:hypothetical protein